MYREKVRLISRNTGDPPVSSLRDKKEVALREESFAWESDLGIFLKLQEIGVSLYLGFIPSLSTLRIFETIEAVRGRLIGPKPWNRINMKF